MEGGVNWKGKLRQREEGCSGSCSTAGGNQSSWLSALAEMESQRRAEKPPEIFPGLVGAWATCAHVCGLPCGLQSPRSSLSPLCGCRRVLGAPLPAAGLPLPLACLCSSPGEGGPLPPHSGTWGAPGLMNMYKWD